MIPAPTKATDSAEIAERLAETRERTLLLIEQLDDEQLNTVYSPLLSPLAWDLGHIANFEELWLVQTAGGREPLNGDLGRFYDAIENPRASRNELPILRGTELRAYMDEVRERALAVLDGIDLEDAPDPVIRDGFAYEMLIAHEQQHNETMLQLLQMVDGYEPPLASPPAAEPDRGGPATIAVAGGGCEVGAGAAGFAYDNERPRHAVEIAPFRIDRLPVSNADFAAFVAATGAEPPLYWERDGAGGWVDSRFGGQAELDPAAPVIHVDHHQASAYAGWAGKRLPTEIEWEVAAAGSDPAAANLDHDGFGTRPPAAATASDCDALGMLGDVWEWTSSELTGYPGFRAFPYREYSEAFFGQGLLVLRGGSWATRRNVIRLSFRNWDLAERRQIFSGFRCAEDG
ncbi:MAG TPA: SUMF1/EgtB/PvdO family nonheme iron enzyme [Solirubrobacterales bacterium]|nr:SUMF1/EgtB/PvdO family nonheme iron enzyme [Solirubrobacterales bacterium]